MTKLGMDRLPTIGTISLLNTYRQVNCTTLSESGDIMASGMADSTVKLTWLSTEALKKSLSLDEQLPQEPLPMMKKQPQVIPQKP
jgi:hypothetical protein